MGKDEAKPKETENDVAKETENDVITKGKDEAKETENDVQDDKPAENGNHVDEKPTENGDVEDEEDEKEANKNGDSNKEDEDGSSSEELGSLEKPVQILTNKRERRSTEFLSHKTEDVTKEGDAPDYSKGKGTAFRDIPFVNWQISKADTEDLVVLHRLLYRKQGKVHLIKKNIREFCGYPFDTSSKHYKSVINLADRLILPGVRYLNGLFGLEKSQDKEKMRADLLEFLMEPKDLGEKVPERNKSKSKKKKKKTPSKKKEKTPGKSKDSKESGEEGGDVSDVSEASDDSDGEEDEEKKPAKPAKPAKSPKSPKKKTPKKPTPVKIAVPSKKSKSASKKRKSARSDASSEDDEPLVKKKKSPPSDAELRKVVAAILKDADLEQVTMKNVVKQVYDKYSSFDLTSRKDYIKTCVKDLIS